MRKNLIICLVALMCFSTSVYAESDSVVLSSDESSDWTDVIGLSDSADYYAANSPNSLFKVYATVYRAYPGKSWKTAKQSLMAKGSNSSGTATGTEDANWQLELNPKGAGLFGCEAVGEISY